MFFVRYDLGLDVRIQPAPCWLEVVPCHRDDVTVRLQAGALIPFHFAETAIESEGEAAHDNADDGIDEPLSVVHFLERIDHRIEAGVDQHDEKIDAHEADSHESEGRCREEDASKGHDISPLH